MIKRENLDVNTGILEVDLLAATNCHRCGEEAQLNGFGLCPQCDDTVDHELKLLYTDQTMEH